MDVRAEPEFRSTILYRERTEGNIGDYVERTAGVEKANVFMNWLTEPVGVGESIVARYEVPEGSVTQIATVVRGRCGSKRDSKGSSLAYAFMSWITNGLKKTSL